MENESQREMKSAEEKRYSEEGADLAGNGGSANEDPASNASNAGQLLLHACCGPCSMEPVRILRERGVEPHIHYSNSNIAPADEYERRLEAIRDWTAAEGITFIEDEYEPDKWRDGAGATAEAALRGEATREDRCRACYRKRLESSARYAAEHGYSAIGTTLTISPYQLTEIIHEELDRAAEMHGLKSAFEDYSPHYAEATRRSREAGMYRQNYCGCAYSKAEAEAERAERQAAREAERDRRAQKRKPQEEALQKRRQERAAYDEKQRRKKAVLKAMREEARQTREDELASAGKAPEDGKRGA